MSTTRMTTGARGVAALLAALVLSACAGIPSSGPVTKVADDSGFGQSTVRYSPARPSAGASPQQIVRGYLDAMLAFPASTSTASAFLTPDAAEGWRSLSGVRIYTKPQVSMPTPSPVSGSDSSDQGADAVDIRLDIIEEARLDRQGHYIRETDTGTDVGYRLRRIDGEWRITNPQVGLLIDRKYFNDYFRPFDIFFFDRPGTRLVPEPVHLPVGDQLSAALVTSLARGPYASGPQNARTYVPALSDLRPSVPVDGEGVADVQFSNEFSQLTESVQDHLSAQIIWTLRQAPQIRAVRLAGGTTALTTDRGSAQSIDSWGAYGPSIARGHAYAIADGRVIQVDDDTVEPLTGAWGRDGRGAVSVAVSDDGVAGVLADRARVRITDRRGADARELAGSRFITPRWDDDGRLWLVDSPAGATRVRLVDGGADRSLPIGPLADLDVRVFSLSADGGRYAVTTRRGSGTALYVGAVLRDAKDHVLGLGDPSRVVTTAQDPASVVWSSGTELSFLAASDSGPQIFSVAIDGSSTTGGVTGGGALLPDVDADTLVVGSGQNPPRYATDAKHRLWGLTTEGSWKLLDVSGVTGLTYGR